MYSRLTIMSCFVSLILLTGCAVVDRFGSRITDHNLTSQDVMNKEILINIVRASRYQPLNFMVITQVNGGQSETMTTGLPTITLGPAQTAAQHQFPISNSVSSGATGGYQTNPLVSSQFQQGMMSPASPKILSYLLASHDRETVYHLVVDSINVTAGKTTLRYVNDPGNDAPAKEGSADDLGLPRICSVEGAGAALQPHGGSERKFLLREDVCNYSKFSAFLKEGMNFGLSAELVPVPAGAAGSRGGGGALAAGSTATAGINTNATATPQATGRLCWDPGLAAAKEKANPRAQKLKPQCGKNLDTKAGSEKFNASFDFGTLGELQFDLRFRSPAAIFAALGKQLHDGSARRVTPLLDSSKRTFDGQPLLVIKTEDTGDCSVSAQYDGHSYCVPQDADRTAMVINILEELKNLSTTPSDLNSAFSVRVVN